MNISTKEIFPELESSLDPKRYARVDRYIQALFQKTLTQMDDGSPFITTGDIPAMWLRDSTWQIKPLLRSKHPKILDFLIQLSKTQVKLFLIDPYANAFNSTPNGNCWHRDFEDQSPWVFERKYELDSWCAVLYLARKLHEIFGTTEHLDQRYQDAVQLMLQLAKREQRHDRENYLFFRENGIAHDSLSHEGLGEPTEYTGMVYSAFRPSDDACKYGYLVPANLFFANELKHLPIDSLKRDALDLVTQIESGIKNYAIIEGKYAYEVDGLGNQNFMDDANIPSLISLPFLEICPSNDPKYLETRKFILSERNPYFFEGKVTSGLGSQHTPNRHIWPIAIAITAMTSTNQSDLISAIEELEGTDSGTGSMHESFHVDDPSIYTREWFSWSDMTYVDLVLTWLDL